MICCAPDMSEIWDTIFTGNGRERSVVIGVAPELPIDVHGTAFQEAVWRELRKIPLGETRSYADIAKAVGDPNATRAVGTANGKNPIAVLVPCHRVIRSDGTLGGYAGGLDRKKKLLAAEGAAIPQPDLNL